MDMNRYLNKGFDKYQLEEIAIGIENGLSYEQIDIYARNDFDRYQMVQIRVGIQNGLSSEQINVFANPVYEAAQMSELRVAFELGMSSKEVSELANPDLSWQSMWRKRCEMRKKNTQSTSLKDTIHSAEAQKHESMAPKHFKQQGFEL